MKVLRILLVSCAIVIILNSLISGDAGKRDGYLRSSFKETEPKSLALMRMGIFCGGMLCAGSLQRGYRKNIALAQGPQEETDETDIAAQRGRGGRGRGRGRKRPRGGGGRRGAKGTKTPQKRRKQRAKYVEDVQPEDEYPIQPISESDLIPVTIITGFLGAGKTTLVNHVLRSKHGMKIAVVENEFGQVSIDDALVSEQIQTNETVITMDNGCICCQLRGDLVDSLRNLALSEKEFECVILETTGLADPVPVAFTFNQLPLSEIYRMDGIVTLVDSMNAMRHIREKPKNGTVNIAVQQIAFADRIVLNKLDLVNSTSKAEIIKEIRSINRFAPIIETNNSVAPLKEILGISAFSIEKAFEIDPSLMNETEHHHDHDHSNCTDDSHHHHHTSKHDLSGVGSYGFEFEGAMSMERLNHFMTMLLGARGPDLYRSKGVLNLGENTPSSQKFVFQGVHEQINLGPASMQWSPEEKRINKFVFIGRNLPPRSYLLDKLKACLLHSATGAEFPSHVPAEEEEYREREAKQHKEHHHHEHHDH